MTPVWFKGANTTFGPPPGFAESQVFPLHAARLQMVGGPCDGIDMVVTAWQPDAADLKRLNEGSPIYLAVIGELPPHYIATEPPTIKSTIIQSDEEPNTGEPDPAH